MFINGFSAFPFTTIVLMWVISHIKFRPSGTKGEMIFVSGLHIVIVVIFSFELLELGERIHTLGVGNQLLDPVSKI